jgi:hypothetical protein
MPPFGRINSNGSLRINTSTSQPRTSSNRTSPEQFRNVISQGIDVTGTALRHIAKPIPGSAALSASLNDAARSLAGSSRLESSGAGTPAATSGDMDSLTNEMARNNQELIEQQIRVGQITTDAQVKTNSWKAYFDTAKNIGSNIR